MGKHDHSCRTERAKRNANKEKSAPAFEAGADFLLAGEGQPITKEISASIRQLGAVGGAAGEHFKTVTDGGQHRLQILLSRLWGAGEV